jgi:hypothetical protein
MGLSRALTERATWSRSTRPTTASAVAPACPSCRMICVGPRHRI